MSELAAVVLSVIPVLRRQRVGLRARLLRAERSINRPFDRRRSLAIDALVIERERVVRRRDA